MTHSRPGTLIDIVRQRAADQGSRTAYVFTTENHTDELTYGQLETRARGVAAGLREVAAPGDRVLIMCAPGLDYVVGFFAALYAGVIAVPAYPPLNARSMSRLVNVIDDALPVAVLADATVLALLAAHDTDNRLAGIAKLAVEQLAGAGGDLVGAPPRPGDVAFLQYTSGSTGEPKGVVVNHANLVHNSMIISSSMGLSDESVCVSWLPPYHDMGLVGGIMQPLYGGFLGVLMTPLDFLQRPIGWLQAITRYGGTAGGTVSGAPDFAFDLCVRRYDPEVHTGLELSSWKVAFSGSEPIRHRTLERFAERFAEVGFRDEFWYPCYGMAETTLFVSGGRQTDPPVVLRTSARALEESAVEPDDDGELSVVGCGRVHAELDVRVADPATLDPLPDGRVGEIVVAGASVVDGYWNGTRRDLFEARLTGLPGRYLRTGDLGFLWDGELFVTGRSKDVLIIRGRNYYPQDIEDCVERAHPLVRPRGVIAFTVEQNGQDQLVVAAEIADQRGEVSLADVTGAVRQAVAEEHGLRVHTVATIAPRTVPKTSNGKLQRSRCRQLFLDGELVPAPVNGYAQGAA
jgi:acyl-CoA synthetase (AMP-forming)/AMP-acid ligase II